MPDLSVSPVKAYEHASIDGTGFDPDTVYDVYVTSAQGSEAVIEVLTDSSGDFHTERTFSTSGEASVSVRSRPVEVASARFRVSSST